MRQSRTSLASASVDRRTGLPKPICHSFAGCADRHASISRKLSRYVSWANAIARYCSVHGNVCTEWSPRYRATIRVNVLQGRQSISCENSVFPAFMGRPPRKGSGKPPPTSNRHHRKSSKSPYRSEVSEQFVRVTPDSSDCSSKMRHSHAEPERIMLNCLITRRTASRGVAGIAAAIALRVGPVRAADKLVKVGLDLPFTGALAESARLVSYGVTMAFDEINANGGVNGYNVVLIPYDDGTATTGQYDPAQAATNARKMVSDRDIVAAIGPLNSGSGKAMAPILSQGGLATITPGSTNPDLTDPKFATQYRPAGKTIYFRTVATDNYQG